MINEQTNKILTKEAMETEYGQYRKYFTDYIRVFEDGSNMLILIEDEDKDLVDEVHIEWLYHDSSMYFKDELYTQALASQKRLTGRAVVEIAAQYSFYSLMLNGDLV
jgi:hypothetical protein